MTNPSTTSINGLQYGTETGCSPGLSPGSASSVTQDDGGRPGGAYNQGFEATRVQVAKIVVSRRCGALFVFCCLDLAVILLILVCARLLEQLAQQKSEYMSFLVPYNRNPVHNSGRCHPAEQEYSQKLLVGVLD